MALVINTNLPAMETGNQIGNTNRLMSSSYERLSTGKKVNKGADGAAAIAISEELSAQLRSLEQAQRNTMDGYSMIQTADGAAGEMADGLGRMRELAVQAANGVLADGERAALQAEFDALRDQMDQISAGTQFNGTPLLNGTADVNLQVGTGASPATNTFNLNIGQYDTTTLGNGTDTLAGMSLGTPQDAINSLNVIDGAMDRISGLRSNLGAAQNSLAATNRNLSVERENIAAANSRISDVDVASEVVEQARNQILMQAQTSVLVQANQLPAMALTLMG